MHVFKSQDAGRRLSHLGIEHSVHAYVPQRLPQRLLALQRHTVASFSELKRGRDVNQAHNVSKLYVL